MRNLSVVCFLALLGCSSKDSNNPGPVVRPCEDGEQRACGCGGLVVSIQVCAARTWEECRCDRVEAGTDAGITDAGEDGQVDAPRDVTVSDSEIPEASIDTADGSLEVD